MNIPKTYKEFLNLSKPELDKICKSVMSLEEAQKMMKFFDIFDKEYSKKPINESSNKIKKFGDYLK